VSAPAHLRARLRPTIRFKLTLWYGAMFLLAGGLLLTVTYILVQQGFEPSRQDVRAAVAERLGISPDQLEPRPPGPATPGMPMIPLGSPHGSYDTQMTVGALIDEIQQEQMQRQLNALLLWSAIAMAIMAVLSLGMGWWLAGRLLRPVHELTALARRLSESTLHERIRLQRPPDELKELADTFDAMLERLDTAFAGQRDFIANASHELRTPLTIIRTELEVAATDPDLTDAEMKDMLAAVGDAVQRSEQLIDSLLVLASSEALAEARPLDLADLARESLERYAATADARSLGVELDLGQAEVHGDAALLGRLLDNLVDNAIRYNVDGGWFRVATETTAAGPPDGGRGAVLTVANSGPQVSEAEAQRLFERFFRADSSRSRRTGGVGLGLSIVKTVAEAHHGTVTATPGAGGGLEVRVTLPSAG
jgi:signal transduction histidine kinase